MSWEGLLLVGEGEEVGRKIYYIMARLKKRQMLFCVRDCNRLVVEELMSGRSEKDGV